MKTLITSVPILRNYDRSKPAVLETDSSDYVNGGVLLQENDDGILHPIAFYSKILLPAECNYEIYDKELLAIVQYLKHLRPELESTDFPVQIFTDHKGLEYFMHTKELTRRQTRWAENLADYNFKIMYRSGKWNGKADALTRLPGSVPADDYDKRRKHQKKALLSPECFQGYQSVLQEQDNPKGGVAAIQVSSQSGPMSTAVDIKQQSETKSSALRGFAPLGSKENDIDDEDITDE